jgi:hypothetical protein
MFHHNEKKTTINSKRVTTKTYMYNQFGPNNFFIINFQ